MDAYHAIRHSLDSMGYDPNEFAIEESRREGRDLVYEATSPSRGMSISARIVSESGTLRVTADVETACHSFKRNVVLR